MSLFLFSNISFGFLQTVNVLVEFFVVIFYV